MYEHQERVFANTVGGGIRIYVYGRMKLGRTRDRVVV